MVNLFKDLTVIIPTIGRESLKSAIESIDICCNLIIVNDSNKTNIELSELIDYDKFNTVNIIKSRYRSPGKSKSLGIKRVDSKYFIILDDDDEFIPGFLELAMKSMKPDVFWLATHYSKSASNLVTSDIKVIEMKDFEYYYFDTSRYEDRLKFIYPGSNVLCDAKLFQSTIELSDVFKYKLDFLDDVIPMTIFMSNTRGLLHLGEGVKQGYVDLSVSHNASDPSENPSYLEVIKTITKFLVIPEYYNLSRSLWKRVLTNLIDVSYFNYRDSLKP